MGHTVFRRQEMNMKTIYSFQTAQPQYNATHNWKVLENGVIMIKSEMDGVGESRWAKWGNFKATCKDLLAAAKKLEMSKK